MKFTFSWLQEFLDTTRSANEIIDGLNKIGHEVEEVINKADIYKPFIIAEITSTSPHPEADKLKVCQVNNGTEILQIVCGAPNARSGIKVVLAPIGTDIPSNGIKIKAAKIRNVDSCGMLCSSQELGLSNESDGIIELDESYIVGSSFAQAQGLNDIFIDIAVTPNRGDCLGVYGIARDLAAAGYGTLKPIKTTKHEGSFVSPLNVTITNKTACPRYIGRYFQAVKNLESPLWLQNRLKSIGETPISALVDITNYFTFAFGRPLHVFDVELLKGNLVVRDAEINEEILALNNKNYILKGGESVIADNEKVVGISGIIGAINSGVSSLSKNIFLEIGLFDADIVTKSARIHQIETDAKFRAERKVDSEFMWAALDLATQMILEICGGTPSHPVIVDYLNYTPRKVDFPLSALLKYTGINYEKSRVVEILTMLGFIIEDKGESLGLTVPSWRHDISIKEDIIEEVARIDGYDKIIAIPLPPRVKESALLDLKQRNLYRIQRFAASLGLNESITWSFMHSAKAKLFADLNPELYLKHPISSELDYMRPSILPNLLEALKKNQNRGIHNVKLFEMGTIFNGIKPDQQPLTLSGIRSGFNNARNIYGDHRPVDLFDSKADILSILAEFGIDATKPQLVTKNLPRYYHPGRAAALTLGKNILGYFGQLHPKIIQEYDLTNVVAFELFLDNIPLPKSKFGRKGLLQASAYQSVTRDFAFLVKQEVSIDTLTRAITSIDKQLIKSVEFFDIYTGKNIAEDEKSIAFSVEIQALDHTLSESEIEELSQKIVSSIKQNANGIQR